MTHAHKAHFFHLIWSTKKRTKWIDTEVKPRLYAYMGGIIRNYNASLLEIGGMPDHVHLIVSIKNLEKYSYLIRDVKSQSTHWVRDNFPALKDFAWQQGIGSFTLHLSLLDTVRKYIQNQEKHHRTMTYEEEYLKFLKGMNIDYDDRFVFD